jgi:hypothetical protein
VIYPPGMGAELSWIVLVAAFLAVTGACAMLAVRLYRASSSRG